MERAWVRSFYHVHESLQSMPLPCGCGRLRAARTHGDQLSTSITRGWHRLAHATAPPTTTLGTAPSKVAIMERAWVRSFYHVHESLQSMPLRLWPAQGSSHAW